jgi:soluble cytochrome b562
MTNTNAIITSLNSKIEKLVFLHQALLEENTKLIQEKEHLLKQYHKQSEQSSDNNSDLTDLKERMDLVIKELDYLIDTLSNGK